MKNYLFLIGVSLTMNAFAQDSMTRALQVEGFSDGDIGVITKISQEYGSSCSAGRAKVIFDKETGRSARKTGTVKFFDTSKREGIIATEDGQLYEFKSGSDIRPGDQVEFKAVIQEGKKGLNAVNVKLA